VPSADLVDQPALKKLTGQIKRDQCASTYLFTGKERAKKSALALAFAKALNCERKSSLAGRDGCACDACRKIDAGQHPDVRLYGADEDAKTIKIAEVRVFKSALALKPYEGKVKVSIFNRAERFTAEAQNALLKSLEEPPDGNVIILLVPQAGSLLDTITSRAIELKVPPFRSKDIRKILVDEGVSESEAAFLASASQGDLGRTREAREAGWFETKNEWLDALTRDPVAFLEGFQGVKRPELLTLFSLIQEYTRDLLVFSVSGDRMSLIHADRYGNVQGLTEGNNFESILELTEAMDQIIKAVRENGNQKLALTRTQMLWEHFISRG
jgi:DNA polymerase III subunit delta'